MKLKICFFIVAVFLLCIVWKFLQNDELSVVLMNKNIILPIHFNESRPTSLNEESLLLKGNISYSKCITLAIVCCGSRVSETLVMLKSVIALTKRRIILHIFAEHSLILAFENFNSSLPLNIKDRIEIHIREAIYPLGINDKAWRSLFKECASLRLFLPVLLPDTDSLLYLDVDVILLAPIDRIWDHFLNFNSSQIAASSPEHEDPAVGWYNRFAKHPYYGRLGINSGVMLMNLTRMRSFGWIEYLAPILKEFRKKITWGDQDIINIIFHYHPGKLYIYGCEYNYRPDHCMYMSVCKSAEKNGVMVLHGNRGVFHNDKQPSFKAVYRAFEEYKLSSDLRQNLYYPMQKFLLQIAKKSHCAKLSELFLKNIASLVAL